VSALQTESSALWTAAFHFWRALTALWILTFQFWRAVTALQNWKSPSPSAVVAIPARKPRIRAAMSGLRLPKIYAATAAPRMPHGIAEDGGAESERRS